MSAAASSQLRLPPHKIIWRMLDHLYMEFLSHVSPCFIRSILHTRSAHSFLLSCRALSCRLRSKALSDYADAEMYLMCQASLTQSHLFITVLFE